MQGLHTFILLTVQDDETFAKERSAVMSPLLNFHNAGLMKRNVIKEGENENRK